MEQYLQVALEFIKEIWFQLDAKFGLKETGAFRFIKPYLLELQNNPAYMGIAFAALALLFYGLYKAISISRERERKLEDLMDEMEDEEDYRDEEDKPLFENEKENLPHDEEKEDALHVDANKVMETREDEFELEPVPSELADHNKDLSGFEDFEGFDFDANDTGNYEHAREAVEKLREEDELTELGGELPADDPFSELDDDGEQDLAIQGLQDEMESTINKITEQLESDPESTVAMKNPGGIGIGDEAAVDDEFILDEETEESGKSEYPEINEPVPEHEPVSLDSIDLTDSDENAPLQPLPQNDYSFQSKPAREADSLISKLKYFQENLDTRFHHREKQDPAPEPKIDEPASGPRFVEQQNFAPRTPPKVSPVDNKKYMEVLESFIFLKNQNKH